MFPTSGDLRDPKEEPSKRRHPSSFPWSNGLLHALFRIGGRLRIAEHRMAMAWQGGPEGKGEAAMRYAVEAIGHVRGGRVDAVDDDWGSVRSAVMLDPARFGADALVGLDGFSHAEILFLFDKVVPATVETAARHPRGRADWPLTGIFAQRGKNRPNRLGVTVCRILSVAGTTLHVEGLDAIDGTPVIDIKPVMREFLPRGDIRQPDWVAELMLRYW